MFPVASNRLFRASRLILHAFREFRLARNSRDTISAGREKKKRWNVRKLTIVGIEKKESFIVTAWISLKYIKMWFLFPLGDNFSICHTRFKHRNEIDEDIPRVINWYNNYSKHHARVIKASIPRLNNTRFREIYRNLLSGEKTRNDIPLPF